MGMGRYIKIKNTMGGGRYAAHHELSDEFFYPVIDRRFRNEFDPLNRDTPEEWCPFLMDINDEGNHLCSVYQSAPPFCRDLKCCTCRIFDREGEPAGIVRGRCTIVTEDKDLEKLWEFAVDSALNLGLDEQKQKIAEILGASYYNVAYYD